MEKQKGNAGIMLFVLALFAVLGFVIFGLNKTEETIDKTGAIDKAKQHKEIIEAELGL